MSEKKIPITPLGSRVVLKPIEKDSVTSSGIIIPDTAAKEKPKTATVVAVGPGEVSEAGQRIAMNVSVGDTVLFSMYSPDEVSVDGVDYLIIKEDSILGVITKA